MLWQYCASHANKAHLNWIERENKTFLFKLYRLPPLCMLKQAPKIGWMLVHIWHEDLGWAALDLEVSCYAKFSSNTNEKTLESFQDYLKVTGRCVWLEMKLNSAGQLTSRVRVAHPAQGWLSSAQQSHAPFSLKFTVISKASWLYKYLIQTLLKYLKSSSELQYIIYKFTEYILINIRWVRGWMSHCGRQL